MADGSPQQDDEVVHSETAEENRGPGQPSFTAPKPTDATDTQQAGSASVERSEPDAFALSRSNQAVLGTLAALVIVLGLLQWGRLSGWGVHPIEIGELPPVENQFRLDINTATEVEWSQLDRIGEVMAERIVRDREQNGNFESIDDLSRVPGIGALTLEQIRPWLTTKTSD